MTPLSLLRPIVAVLFAAGLAAAASAQETRVAFGAIKADTSLPVEVTADTLDVNQETGEAVFTGNVVIGQGEMRLAAPRVLIVYKSASDGIERMEATGGVTLVSGPDAAEAERAEYTIDRGVIVMTGNVLLTQGRSALTSEQAVINLTTGTAQMTGRVRTILQSGSD